MIANITGSELIDDLLAIPAFASIAFCPGYLAASATDLFKFRTRSLIERVFWSIPLSLAVSPILAFYLGLVLPLSFVCGIFLLGAGVCLTAIAIQYFTNIRGGKRLSIGFHPYGWTALLLAFSWVALVLLSLLDFQSGQDLFTSLINLDHCFRIDWTQSILHSGVPPDNPLYLFHHPAPMRNYYFWYLLCAVVVRSFHVTVRASIVASCVWAGFGLASVIGLYLKHFLTSGLQLRRKFIIAVLLMSVSGFDILANAWNLFVLHILLPPQPEFWSLDPVFSWYADLLWVPHHAAALSCCMFAFLIARRAAKSSSSFGMAAVVFMAAAFASAFGESAFVPFGMFLVMLAWGVWQVFVERTPRATLLLAAGGALAIVLLSPFLWQLTRSSSRMQGGRLFGFWVKEMIPPDGLVHSRLLHTVSAGHPAGGRILADTLLLVPGYFLELGFFFLVLLIILFKASRKSPRVTAEVRSLLFISIATLVLISFVRSWVLTNSNDFGWRVVLIAQFCLLLLGSELISSSSSGSERQSPRGGKQGGRFRQSVFAVAITIGVISTFMSGFFCRFLVALQPNLPSFRLYTHKPYILHVGYGKLNRLIPADAVVQADPAKPDPWKLYFNVMNIGHQTAITTDQPWCGSELGGDSAGCSVMGPAIDKLFEQGSPSQARSVCREFGIQYLVTTVYDPAWKDKQSWVWALNPVVADPEFRALDCR